MFTFKNVLGKDCCISAAVTLNTFKPLEVPVKSICPKPLLFTVPVVARVAQKVDFAFRSVSAAAKLMGVA